VVALVVVDVEIGLLQWLVVLVHLGKEIMEETVLITGRLILVAVAVEQELLALTQTLKLQEMAVMA
jgi:hypothetical protein